VTRGGREDGRIRLRKGNREREGSGRNVTRKKGVRSLSARRGKGGKYLKEYRARKVGVRRRGGRKDGWEERQMRGKEGLVGGGLKNRVEGGQREMGGEDVEGEVSED